MNSINDFLNKLSHLGINLWLETSNKSGVETSKLKYSAPKEAMTPDVVSELKERKAEVIQFLQANQNQDSSESPIQPVSRDGNLPLSFAQQRLWFIDQLEGSSATYNWPYTLRFKGDLNLSALEKSLTEIVRRHETLRTTFAVVNNTPTQKIHPPYKIALPVLDLESFPESEREAEAQKAIAKEQEQPFDLVQDRLLRVMLVRLSPDNHLFCLTMHHIVADGWFNSIFMRELTTLYEAFCAGKPSPLEELTLQYADFAAWQRDHFQGEILQRQVNYWKQQLAGIPPLLELPSDRQRPTLQTFTGDKHLFHLNKHLTQQLRDLSKKSGATLFITLLTAFATLLYRYSDQSDVVVGSPIANRNRSEIEGIIGFFVNTLAFRTKFEDNPTFEQLLTQVRQTALEAYEYQDLPFEKLVEELKPERSLSHSPVFQTMFILQNFPLPKLSMSGLDISILEPDNSTAKFDLTLEIREVNPELTKALEYNRQQGIEDGLIGRLEYNIDLFDAATIARMAEHFKILLEAIVANPHQPVNQLPLLTAAEQHQQLVEWNHTEADYPHICIHQLFEKQVAKTPDAVALKFAEEELSYRKLNEKANQLAHYLQTLGVKPGVLVGICLERSPDLIIALLAILKAGGAYVPLDPDYPSERLAYMLDDSQVSILLTTESLLSKLPETKAKIVFCDTPEIDRAITANPVSAITPNDLAYIIYTSGSTGKPKGVMIAHQGLCNLATAQVKLFDVSSSSRILQFASFSFDAAIWEIVMALGSGACLCLGTLESLLPGKNLLDLLKQQKVTHITLPPSALAALPQAELSNLEVIIVAGEACPIELAKQWLEKHRFFNAYGPSESTVCATVAECKNIAGSLSIGKPIANTEIYILDKNLQPVPVGVPGELHISSVGLAQGYWNRPELTKEKFIPNPFSVNSQQSTINDEQLTINNQRIYKTGDRAKYLPGGNIEFIGRIDNQVKIRGFRIELGEIESALAQYPHIEQSVVIAREDVPGDKRLVAYVVPKQDQTIPTEEIRSFLQETLPNYMIPGFFVILEQMPLTPNGKIDRKALPQPEGNRLENSYVQPQTEIETKIATVWQEVLNLDKVGIHDNFFDLGGHSLLIAQVQSKLADILDQEISMLDIFTYPTIHAFAQHITRSPQESIAQSNLNRAKQRSMRKASIADKRKSRKSRRETN